MIYLRTDISPSLSEVQRSSDFSAFPNPDDRREVEVDRRCHDSTLNFSSPICDRSSLSKRPSDGMKAPLPLVKLPPSASIHRFGSPSSAPRSSALLRFPPDGWTIDSQAGSSKQGWAIVGDAEGRRTAVETLLSRHRIHPIQPPPGPFPYTTSLESSSSTPDAVPGSSPTPIRHLAFARPPTSGEFTDFTARYGALQEEDKLTFRQTLSSLHPPPSAKEIDRVAKIMRIHHLLDLPLVSQSSGQTRRGRIAAAMLSRPVLLLLEDPMAGLDIKSREEVARLLGELNESGDIRVVLVLRAKGVAAMPDWVTDVCEVRGGDVWIGQRAEWEERAKAEEHEAKIEAVEEETGEPSTDAQPIIRLQDVSVSYGEGSRPVLKEVSWEIKPGERWHLQGANGSGKTTLLSLVLGHHPRSYSLPASALTLFSKPRRGLATPTLRTLIGHTSPEIFASFPRGMGLSAFAAIGTGFEGVFSRRTVTEEQKARILSLIEYFGPLLTSTRPGQTATDTINIAKRDFAHFAPPQQALLLFLRAIVSRTPLVILDEPSQGMDEVIWERCKELLRQEWAENPDQAVIVVSHYDDEVPWSKSRGKIMRLVDGRASFD